MTQNPQLADLSSHGVAVWLDDLSRDRINSGGLAALTAERSVVGITTNPTIFGAAISGSDIYNDQISDLSKRGVAIDEALRMITAYDVRAACDVLAATAKRTGRDGRVSFEVDPRLAFDTHATFAEATSLWWLVDRPNLFIKIPATQACLPAITDTIAEGISVNVTLIFSLDRHRAVMDAYLSGLEQAHSKNVDLSSIRSVASFFVSRIDTEVDKRLDALSDRDGSSDELKALRSKAAIANARLAYQSFEDVFSSDRWSALEAAGAHRQRPLWASTSVKDPDLPDTMYVDGLVAPDTVNTMPEATIDATADHGDITGDTVTPNYDDAQQVIDRLEKVGVSYDEMVQAVEDEGVDKFAASWKELQDTVEAALEGDPDVEGSK